MVAARDTASQACRDDRRRASRPDPAFDGLALLLDRRNPARDGVRSGPRRFARRVLYYPRAGEVRRRGAVALAVDPAAAGARPYGFPEAEIARRMKAFFSAGFSISSASRR